MGVKKWERLHPKTANTPMKQDDYVRREVRRMLSKPRHVHTTSEYRQWLINQAAKKGML